MKNTQTVNATANVAPSGKMPTTPSSQSAQPEVVAMISDTNTWALTYCVRLCSVRLRNAAAGGPPVRRANLSIRGASSTM